MAPTKGAPSKQYTTKTSPGAKKGDGKGASKKGAAKQMAPFLKKKVGRF